MARIRRNTFNAALRLVKTLFQTGKFVQESEANEMEDNLRVQVYRAAYLIGYDGVESGFTWKTDGVNTFTLNKGNLVADGYAFLWSTDPTIAGLTTPLGVDRQDTVYLEITETEIADPSPDPVLGEQSRRVQLQCVLRVAEGAAMPASTGDPYSGGTWRFLLGALNRLNGNVNCTSTMWVPQFNLLPGQILAQIVRLKLGIVDHIVAGAAGLVAAETIGQALGFVDTVLSQTRVNLTDASGVVDISDAGRTLLSPGQVTQSTPTASIIRMVNGRGYMTVGDGVNTFGDLNGSEAPRRLLAAFWAAHPGKHATMYVKAGTYAMAGPIVVAGPLKIIGEGDSLTGTGKAVISYGVTATIADGGSSYAVEIENLEIDATGYTNAISLLGQAASSRYLSIARCKITGGVLVENPRDDQNCPGVVIRDSRLTACAAGTAPNDTLITIANYASAGATMGSLLIDNCVLDQSAKACAVISLWPEQAGDMPMRQITIRNTKIITSEFSAVASPSPTQGLISLRDTTTSNVYLNHFSVEDCRIENSGGTNGGPWWNYCPGKRYGTATYDTHSTIKSLSFTRCTFYAAVANTRSPFFRMKVRDYGGGAVTGEDDTTRAVFTSCTFDFNAKTAGQDPEDNAAGDQCGVLITANHITMRDTIVSQWNVKMFIANTAMTNYHAAMALLGVDKKESQGFHAAQVIVDGYSWEKMSVSGGGFKANYGLLINGQPQSTLSLTNLNWNAQFMAETAVVVLPVQVGTNAALGPSLVRVSSCRFRGFSFDAALSAASTNANGGVTELSNIYAFGMLTGTTIQADGQFTTVRNVYVEATTAGAGSGLNAAGGSAGGLGVLLIEGCTVKNCGAACTWNGGCVTLLGNVFIGNNANAHQCVLGAYSTITIHGNRFETSVNARARFTSATTNTNIIGGDDASVNTLGSFTNGQNMRFNYGLV